VILAVIALLSLGTVTGAFDATDADRGVHIGVTNDDALFGTAVETPIELANGHHRNVRLLVLSNRFPRSSLLVTAVIEHGAGTGTPPNVRITDAPNTLESGESDAVLARITCGNVSDRSETFTVTVEAHNQDVSVTTRRDVTITCSGEPQSVSDPQVDFQTETTG
jgi:hypothetical protein